MTTFLLSRFTEDKLSEGSRSELALFVLLDRERQTGVVPESSEPMIDISDSLPKHAQRPAQRYQLQQRKSEKQIINRNRSEAWLLALQLHRGWFLVKSE